MQLSKRLVRGAFALAIGVAMVAGLSVDGNAAPGKATPPDAGKIIGTQARPKAEAVAPDSAAARKAAVTTMAPASARSKAAVAAIGSSSWATYNYCAYNEVYQYVYNDTASTAYVRVDLYESSTGVTRSHYISIAAYSYGYQYWYGVYGVYYAYLYVWNGSYYAYNSYKTSTHTCSVSTTVAPSSVYPGWVYVTAANYGTAYATTRISELVPAVATTYLYPAAGSSASQWVYVGAGAKYAFTSHTLYSSLTPQTFVGTAY